MVAKTRATIVVNDNNIRAIAFLDPRVEKKQFINVLLSETYKIFSIIQAQGKLGLANLVSLKSHITKEAETYNRTEAITQISDFIMATQAAAYRKLRRGLIDGQINEGYDLDDAESLVAEAKESKKKFPKILKQAPKKISESDESDDEYKNEEINEITDLMKDAEALQKLQLSTLETLTAIPAPGLYSEKVFLQNAEKSMREFLNKARKFENKLVRATIYDQKLRLAGWNFLGALVGTALAAAVGAMTMGIGPVLLIGAFFTSLVLTNIILDRSPARFFKAPRGMVEFMDPLKQSAKDTYKNIRL